jgi:2-C-methyl-D-erythritol 4-phosphate cytidylyltransferase
MQAAIVLVAAGAGARFGRPKALVELGGMTLLARSAAAFEALPHRVAVVRSGDADTIELPGWTIVAGGATRSESVARGVAAVGPEADVILVHDAARPLVPPEVVRRVLAAAERAPAVVPVVPVADTVKELDGERVTRTLDRSRLGAAQTPQAFAAGLLRRALAASHGAFTDEAGLVEHLGEPVVTVPGDPRNLKITTPLDLRIAAALVDAD